MGPRGLSARIQGLNVSDCIIAFSGIVACGAKNNWTFTIDELVYFLQLLTANLI